MRVALFEPEIHINVGNIIRSCACFGFELDIIEPCNFIFDLSKLKRSAMDYTNHCKITTFNSINSFLEKTLQPTLQPISPQIPCRILAITPQGDTAYDDYIYEKGDVLLFGKESTGLPTWLQEKSHARLLIPMQKQVRSLNLANAVSVVSSYMRSNLSKRSLI